MKNPLALSSAFFTEHTVTKWQSVLKAGITEAEISVNSGMTENLDNYLDEVEKQYGIITEAGMKVSSFHLPFGKFMDISGPEDETAEKAVEINKKILDWVAEKVIGISILHGSYEPIVDEERGTRIDRAIKSIKALGEYSKKKNTILAVENLPRSCLGNTSNEILKLIEHGKTALICFDVNHLLIETHKDFYMKTSPHIISTHLSDYDRTNEKHWIPGDGCIDWKELVGLFESAGYTGRFLFELTGTAKSSPNLNRDFTPGELVSHFLSATGINAS